MVLLKLLLIFCSLGGFLLSLYIYHKKHTHEKMLCPIGGHCASVIASEYARFFGIPLEIIGMVYYAAIFVAYTVLFVAGSAGYSLLAFLLFGMTITAFLFSLYLTFIQAFTLKQWCTLCLTSAGLCTIIFGSALATSEQSFMALLTHYQAIISAFYLLALAVGLGCATVTDIFFLKFLKDSHISQSEYDVLKTLAQIVWAALSAIVVAGVGIALGIRDVMAFSPALLTSWIALCIILVNTSILNLVVAPKLLHISFRQEHDHEPGELSIYRKLSFELGAISLISWYTAFILTVVSRVTLSLPILAIIYVIVLIIGVAIARGIEYGLRYKD